MKTHARCSSHLRHHAISLQRHRVISRGILLLRAVGIRPQARLLVTMMSSSILHLAHNWHHRHIKQVADTRTRQVRMRKTYHREVALVITRTPVPILRDAGWAHLHQTKWHIRSHKYVTVTTRTDTLINPLCKILLLCTRSKCHRHNGATQHRHKSLHNSRFIYFLRSANTSAETSIYKSNQFPRKNKTELSTLDASHYKEEIATSD